MISDILSPSVKPGVSKCVKCLEEVSVCRVKRKTTCQESVKKVLG